MGRLWRGNCGKQLGQHREHVVQWLAIQRSYCPKLVRFLGRKRRCKRDWTRTVPGHNWMGLMWSRSWLFTWRWPWDGWPWSLGVMALVPLFMVPCRHRLKRRSQWEWSTLSPWFGNMERCLSLGWVQPLRHRRKWYCRVWRSLESEKGRWWSIFILVQFFWQGWR